MKQWTQNCQGMSRRDGLKLGLGGLISGGLSGALRATASEDGQGGNAFKKQADACILIWMDGGPSHYETFDPKPEAPVEIRGQFSPIATQTPGMFFSQPMKRLAGISNDLAIVRSIRHDQGNHGAGNHYMMTGAPPRIPVGCGAFVSFHPSLGSVVSHQVGAPDGVPPYFSMPNMSRSGGPNFLGARHAPFIVPDDPNRSGFRVRDVTIPTGLTDARFESRQEIRRQVDKMQRLTEAAIADPVVAADEFYSQGMQILQSSEAQAAFDIHSEPGEIRNAYGRSPFGQRALLARRLVGAGVPFVTLYFGGWDDHTDLFNAFEKKVPPFESAIAALIEDLKQQGMLDRTMVIALGEFGRTPKINDRGGRDHWSNAMSVMFAGGGTRGGQVIGATDRQGYAAVERILSPENFVSTIYRKLGIDPGQMMYSPDGRPVHLVSDAEPITELMG
ncbi:DUF1501 domain-containing protein [Rubripirellula sp.]|jgi:hypothetical protein|nr:DUF1501 domain-containing protein [Rubripirellula sp.]MDB4749823.1 DUF1501 domain-containing protein [Rubripirellula sp.]